MADQRDVVTLGVAGGSGSGKTTVARSILNAVGQNRIAYIAHDSYYRDVEWESNEQQALYNFDHPDAVETDLLVEHLETLKAGQQYTLRPEPVASTADLDKLKKGLVAYWSFDQRDGSTIPDHAGNADGQIVGGPQRLEGLRGRCVQLSGEQHVRVPGYKDVLGPSGNIENLTVSYWYRTNYFGCGRIGRSIGKEIERQPANWYYSTTANVAGWDLTCRGTKGGAFLTAGFDGGVKGFKFNGGPGNVISDGFDWYHVVAIYDGSRKALEMYINGVAAPLQCFDFLDDGPQGRDLHIGKDPSEALRGADRCCRYSHDHSTFIEKTGSQL